MTYYEVLEVTPTASDDVILIAYRTLMKKYNPNNFSGDRAYAERRIAITKKAYRILSDPELRKKYDQYLINQEKSSPSQSCYSTKTRSSGKYRTAKSRKKKHRKILIILLVAMLAALLIWPEEFIGNYFASPVNEANSKAGEISNQVFSETKTTIPSKATEDLNVATVPSASIRDIASEESTPISEPVASPIPVETQAIVNDQAIFIEGYVAGGTGGLNIRNGPGTSFSQVGRLAEYEAVIVDQTEWSDNREWGHIDRGWICMDFVVLGTPPDVSNTYLVGYIIGSLEGVNVRSGPAVEYTQVGKVPLGKQVIVTKLCNNGVSEWGYIGDGWVCTEYINFGEPGPGTDFPY